MRPVVLIVLLSCLALVYAQQAAEWRVLGGCNTVNCAGVYGSPRFPTSVNWPGGRTLAGTWTDKAQRLWMFGGAGFGNATLGGGVLLSDMWVYDPDTTWWTWISGSTTGSTPNVVGPTGSFGPTYSPGARSEPQVWYDEKNNQLWLFGGYYVNALPKRKIHSGFSSDLWVFDVKTAMWAFMGGNSDQTVGGNYGTKGKADPSNWPPQRGGAVTWTNDDKFYMFGGESASGSYATRELLSDVWMFDPSTRQWTWLAGPNTPNSSGQPGAKGSGDFSTTPSARFNAGGWTDNIGYLWMFGGEGVDNKGSVGLLNDLWRFNPNTNVWTWEAGALVSNQESVYGSLRTVVTDAKLVPGSRSGPIVWGQSNVAGGYTLWLMGGYGYDSAEKSPVYLSDMWAFDTTTKQFSWMDGPSTGNTHSVYSVVNPSPGARFNAMEWASHDTVFMLGGFGYSTHYGYLNDGWHLKGLPTVAVDDPARIYVPIIVVLIFLLAVALGVVVFFRWRYGASDEAMYSPLPREDPSSN